MDNTMLIAGRIIEITDSYVTIHNVPEVPRIIEYNKKVKLSILNGNVGYKTLIATVYASTNKILKLVELKEMDDFEKRTFYRLNVSLNGLVSPLLESNADDITIDTDEQKPISYEVTIENVSLSGVFLRCPQQFQLRDRIRVTIFTPLGKLEFDAVIRRIEEKEDSEAFGYGCEVEEYPDKLGDALWKYMMYKEREDIRKMRGVWSAREQI